MIERVESIFKTNRGFVFLVIYRWVTLIPAIFVIGQTSSHLPPLVILALALTANLVITVFNRPLNKLVLDWPASLGIDLLFSGALLAMSGGAQSPYYLHALSPLLAGAFLFQTRGALLTALFFTPLYVVADRLGFQGSPSMPSFVMQLAGIWLIPLLFAYPSALLKSVKKANEDLASAHRQLEIIHDLTVLLQAAPDLISVQERVLGAVTTDLGFSKAVVATVDPAREEIGGWLTYPPEKSFPKPRASALHSGNGRIMEAIHERTSILSDGQNLAEDAKLDEWLKQRRWLIIPMYLREHPVGVLLVDESDLTPERESTLMTVTNQAALALGTTILCIDRARRLAVETERNRIARDIHDTVAQSLFGILYSLDACITMLPEKAMDVRNELIELRSLANTAHDEVRRSIFDLWPSALTLEMFISDLTNYVSGCCRPRPFSIVFANHGDFNLLSPGMKRTVYRMAQEALANSARHSGAKSARLCLTVTQNDVYLVATDEGKGFDPSVALSRSLSREHFGLQGILERAHAMGGECEVISRPGAGARVMIRLPAA